MKDTYYLARMAAVNNRPEVATGLVEQAIVQATQNENATIGNVPLQNMQQMLGQQQKKIKVEPVQDPFPQSNIPPKK